MAKKQSAGKSAKKSAKESAKKGAKKTSRGGAKKTTRARAAKRELIDTGTDKRFARRGARGEFKQA
ncbi:MAG TPA: hypothetical protein VMZ90_14705, partial [Vicinamibacterales bacterium]|nr:hypothetical protein [Vicinamibacterales bacterium]